jgi:hypothetical protein
MCGVAATRLTPFVRRSNDEHHGFCPSPWAEVIYSLAAMPHELIRLKVFQDILKFCGLFGMGFGHESGMP